jgi:hypothetical protein
MTSSVMVTLAAVPGTWTPTPVAHIYQWYRSGVAITGPALPSYIRTANDRGETITLRVAGKEAGLTTTFQDLRPHDRS